MRPRTVVLSLIGLAFVCAGSLMLTRSGKPKPVTFKPNVDTNIAAPGWGGPFVSHDFSVPGGTLTNGVLQAQLDLMTDAVPEVDGLHFTTLGTNHSSEAMGLMEVEERELGKPPGSTKSVFTWWSPVTNAVGYRVYNGLSSRNYTGITDAGHSTNCFVSSLKANTTYYFAVTCYTTNGLESDFSAEVVFKTSK